VSADPILQLRDVTQEYGALRPLRIKSLDLRAGQRLAILGIDQGAGEVLVNLLTDMLYARVDPRVAYD
jgi:ABC-type branched-subunit amino acid transport system ATPase component